MAAAGGLESGSEVFCGVYELGNGTFGPVFSGIYQKMPVAVKKIPLTAVNNQNYILYSQLNHSNVIKLFHVSCDGEFKYFYLELSVGSLSDYCMGKYTGPVPFELDGLFQMTRGVQYLHSQNFVHGAIKPENILISFATPGMPVMFKIADFGFYVVSSRNVDHRHMEFSAPELIAHGEYTGKKKSNASDVFSLGCVFYYYVTRGGHPFGEEMTVANIECGRADLSKLPQGHFVSQLIHQMILSEPQSRPCIYNIISYLQYMFPAPSYGIIRGQGLVNCYKDSDLGAVNCCCFHPFQPILACGLDKGSVCFFTGSDRATPLYYWRKTFYHTKSRKVFIWKMQWKMDGTLLLAGCFDGTLVCWNLSGQKEFERRRHSNTITCVEWNSSEEFSHLFITADEDGVALLWDGKSGKTMRRYQSHSDAIRAVTWVSGQQFASSSSDKTIQVFSISSETPLTTFHHLHSVYGIHWSATDNLLASCSFDGSIRIWSITNVQLVNELAGVTPVCCLDWFENFSAGSSTSLIACGNGDGSVTIWNLQDTSSRNPVKLTGHSHEIEDVAFSPNGVLLATIDQGGYLSVWLTANWQVVICARLPGTFLKSLSWNAVGSKLSVANTSPQVFVAEFNTDH